ncbi:MAG: diaminopropionate ammonia-lyase [Candidatus Puniceispirillaceae bacterium]|jgi:diaminopropionate ammonia-lyase
MDADLTAALAAPFTLDVNPGHSASPFPNRPGSLDGAVMDRAQAVISGWDGYAPTALHDLPEIADHLGVARVVYKDESTRFGLGSFKALGGAYAVAALVGKIEAGGGNAGDLTVATATDGNHGRSVAWGAARAGCAAKIYIHAHVSKAREDAMAAFGAEVIRIDGNYEASLAACKQDAEAHGWQIVSDTSWEGYHEVPLMVMAGYTVMAREIVDQLGTTPSHAMLPVGVGGLAAGIIAPLWQAAGSSLGHMIAVESHMSACMRDSLVAGTPTLVDITEETLMAGLSCGEVSDLAWDILKPTVSHCVTVGDEAVAPLMRWFHHRAESIEAGECSTSGLAALLVMHEDRAAWEQLSMTPESVVLLVGTEGATDPDFYRQTVGAG